jgi:hypothetical protein
VASETAELREYYANHRWFVIGGIGAVLAALVGFVQLRKGSAMPAINVTLPAGSAAPAGFSPSDLLSAYGAGSAATAAGSEPLVGLGQGGLDLARSSLAAESDTLQALGNTQASMGGSLAQLLAEWGHPATAQPVPPVASPPLMIGTPLQASNIGTLESNPAVRLLDGQGGMVVPSSRTYQLGPMRTVLDPALGTQAPAYQVSDGGRTLYLLARNVISIG